FLILFFIFFAGWQIKTNQPVALAATPEELKSSIVQKAEELQKINEQINKTQKELEETKEEGKTLKKELTKVSGQISQINLGIKSSEILIEKMVLEAESLQYDLSEIENKIENNKKAIAQTLRELQTKDDESPLLIILKNKSLAQSVFEMQGLSDLNSALSTETNEMQSLKTQMNEKLEETSKKKKSKEVENINLKNKKVIVEDVKKEKQVVLEQTKNQEKKYQETLEELQKLQDEITEEISIYEEELRLKIDPAALPTPRPGILGVPIEIPPARLTQKYGSTSFVRRQGRTWHNGVDFGAPIGTPVLAAESGTVIAFGDQDNYRVNGKRPCYKAAYGKFAMVKHENNLTTLYAHLSRWIVNINDKVEKGQVIGYSGNTGRSTGPHLHFTLYATQTIPPATPGYYEGTRSSNTCGPLPVGGDLNSLPYLAL
ncbi:MAG: peptidoglycan DD-metalloendopeptidase family protein, partial [Patescibacteria group bacterium]